MLCLFIMNILDILLLFIFPKSSCNPPNIRAFLYIQYIHNFYVHIIDRFAMVALVRRTVLPVYIIGGKVFNIRAACMTSYTTQHRKNSEYTTASSINRLGLCVGVCWVCTRYYHITRMDYNSFWSFPDVPGLCHAFECCLELAQHSGKGGLMAVQRLSSLHSSKRVAGGFVATRE